MTTKEEYFRKCAQGRTRSYLRDAQAKLAAKSPSSLSPCQLVIDEFKSRLDLHQYYAGYFDRTHRDDAAVQRLCDSAGSFVCQGKYNQDSCENPNSHVINPYETAESRILFSTWNLDHVIERATLLSELSEKLKKTTNRGRSNGNKNACDECTIQHYYDMLFTRKNLKLVHKTCHVIGPHQVVRM